MEKYIGVKMVEASPSTYFDFLKVMGRTPSEGAVDSKGYIVTYEDGYTSFSPNDVFEAAYYPLTDSTRITEQDVNNFMVPGTGTRMGAKTTVVMDSTITGFDTVGISACVDPNNYNQEIGEKYAREDIKSKIWGHLGFVLQWAKNGLK